ncbi:hypothetical protein WSM22_14190 [Cytophagales bacterium WSM2-2]|nr:hypothetical protein WSM22_14190 [Cytophagales bacterium WSM2-2]
MNKDWKYILYLCALGGLLLMVMLGKDQQYDWKVTLAHEDKNPYGTFALNELLSDEQKIEYSYKTFYEERHLLREKENVIFLAEGFYPDKEDAKAMLIYAQHGGAIFISANHIGGKLADTLGVNTKDYFFQMYKGYQQSSDSTSLHLSNINQDTTHSFFFRRDNIHNYLAPADTARTKNKPEPATILARNDKNQPVAIRINYGKGQFIFCSTPMIFTNIYLLSGDNHALVSSLLSYLPNRKIFRSEYYQLGRLDVRTPLRYILTTEPLRWAYYIIIGSILIFIVFEAKRKQRIIPVVKPLANTSLEFVGTIGNLYLENSDHKSIAMKKILFFNDALRNKLNFSMSMQAESYVQMLSLKAGVDETVVRPLTELIQTIHSKEKVSSEELIQLNVLIQNFWNK